MELDGEVSQANVPAGKGSTGRVAAIKDPSVASEGMSPPAACRAL